MLLHLHPDRSTLVRSDLLISALLSVAAIRDESFIVDSVQSEELRMPLSKVTLSITDSDKSELFNSALSRPTSENFVSDRSA